MSTTLSAPAAAAGVLRWDFPLPRTHTGVLLGNGVQGLMVWGDARLHVTVGRAGFWDHRGGNAFATRTTYQDVRQLLEADDAAGIARAFAAPAKRAGWPDFPTQVGCGRLELAFADGLRPLDGELDLRTGTLRIRLRDPGGRCAEAHVHQAMDAELAWIELEAGVSLESVTCVPTWDHIGARLAQVGVAAPQRWTSPAAGGFCQTLPEDAPCALAWQRHGQRLVIATALGDQAGERARAAAAASADLDGALRAAKAWWVAYWADVPRVSLPDPALQEVWDYGVYKQAGLTTPGGIAASLQGPWLEEYQLPPWSCDYHFNINIQMIYWPCLGTNRLAHLQPLWDMIRAWLPRLQENAERFFGAPDALMLPHAVDDRCQVVGTFWAGTIDHACTAWMAQLAWLHYRHGMDATVLRDLAWPLLVGAFNGYWAMLEERDEGGRRRLSLPVSVSPEYRGSEMNAWGRDASFQLAALHFVAATLPRAADLLGREHDPRWARVSAELPPYTLVDGLEFWDAARTRTRPRIGLWQGQDLEQSHRHHSHLGAIYPFCTLSIRDPAHRQVVADSLYHWVSTGAGGWSGWCVPWAAILCARCDQADGAVTWLHHWRNVFTNLGRGTLHDADFPGQTVLGPGFAPDAGADGSAERTGEIMQMDAGMGAVTAILELLVQVREGVITVLPALPRRWRAFAFDGVRSEGAFLIGATVAEHRCVEVRVTSLVGGRLRLAHGLPEGWMIDGAPGAGPILDRDTSPDEQLVLSHPTPGVIPP